MFGKRYTLFHLLGFPIRIDASWLFIAVLITWSLATGYFPYLYKHLPPDTYWIMGVLGALGLFTSIVLHELSHATVAKKYGIEMKGITLFIFGGVAEMTDEPQKPMNEFLIAVAGPIASFLIAGICLSFTILGIVAAWPVMVTGIFAYLMWINAVLASFNLVPAFPLDGGRMLRAALWGWKKDLRWATRITTGLGGFFGIVMIFTGFVSVLAGNFLGGLWRVMLGIFLQQAAKMSYQDLLLRSFLRGEKVRSFMKADPVTVPASVSLEHFINDYVFRHHFKMYPVWDGQDVSGFVTTDHIKRIPRQEWTHTMVRDVMAKLEDDNTISPDEDAMTALSKMSRSSRSRLLVMDRNRLTGILTLKDFLTFFGLKAEMQATR